MTRQLEERVAIVTGASSGIGAAASRAFLAEGAKVMLAARSSEAAEVTLNRLEDLWRGRVAFCPTDISSPSAASNLVEETVSRFGGLDIVYSNAGHQEIGDLVETSDQIWQQTLAVNLSGQFYLSRAAMPLLEGSEHGSLILTASELGTVGTSRSVAYCAAKGGVVNMTRAIAVDCRHSGVRVNCLCPGPIDTPMLRRWFDGAEDPAVFRQQQLAPVLLKRIGRPEEIASAALFLASDASSYMTGAVLVIDGGVTSWYGL